MGTSLLTQSKPQVFAPQPPCLLDEVSQTARLRGAFETTYEAAVCSSLLFGFLYL